MMTNHKVHLEKPTGPQFPDDAAMSQVPFMTRMTDAMLNASGMHASPAACVPAVVWMRLLLVEHNAELKAVIE